MKQVFFSRSGLALILGFGFVFGVIIFADKNEMTNAEAATTGDPLIFFQDWTNTDEITVDDDWSGVTGIVGYRGDALTNGMGTDLRTILANGDDTPVDVNANENNPSTFSSGGIAEFDAAKPTFGTFNPVIAFQGSGTADVPHLVISLNTTGLNNLRLQYNARDIDDQTNDAIQQINTQYRVSGMGNYINLPGGYIADATTEGQNDVTAVDVNLPMMTSDQTLVEIRIMTTNAVGSDEFIGIDDIRITTTGVTESSAANVDFNGDGRSDYVVTRPQQNLGGSTLDWFIMENGSGNLSGAAFGLFTDRRIPSDYDGDGSDDIAIWRPDNGNGAAFYILNSSDGTVRIDNFGLLGDDPKVVGDYDGDGADDVAVYRQNVGGQNFFYYRGSNGNGDITYVPWGSGEFVRPSKGDYDGDGLQDFLVYDQSGLFTLLRSSNGQVEYINWGLGSEAIVPGDFDGDGVDDYCVVRNEDGQRNWYILGSQDITGAGSGPIPFGLPGDRLTPGDYDGDGREDIAVWRPSEGLYYILNSRDGSVSFVQYGQMGDDPEANWKVHNSGVN